MLPPNPEKYLFLNVQMVTITNPQVIALQPPYQPRRLRGYPDQRVLPGKQENQPIHHPALCCHARSSTKGCFEASRGDWSRDVIHHPKFSQDVAAYRKNKSSYNLSRVYQAIRKHHNLSIPHDSASNIKSVLDHVK
ncbi:hypothetical protein [Brevibacillus nitrificans]|uniref:hypothetical protein n=1 Tax=Brevibacillus nitrificans TaxID=651560 RepID=UPI00285CADFF|nr:hypothetical protein [Brevibacillus nitrificans]MDR7317082.1 hypothetical protein [Brevibacillus nitrificans]